jgi:hypothetical protein
MRRALWLAPVAALLVTFARSLRQPDPWAATQAMFTCDIAPKRCGFGQALAWLHIPVGHFAVYAAVSTALLCLVVLVYGLALARSGLARSAAGLIMIGSLAASYGFGVFIALNGSLDLPMALLAAASFLVRGRFQVAVVAICAVIGVLVHEAYLVIFLPATVLPLVLRAERARDWIAPVAVVGAGVLVAGLCALGRPLSPAQAAQALKLLQARADFPLEPYGFAILRRSLSDNLAMMADIGRTHWFWSLQLANAMLLLPVAGLFLTVVCLGWRAPAVAKLAAVATAFTPLAMNLLGYDVLRWGGLSILTMGLSLAALSARYGAPLLRSPLFAGVAAMFAVIPLLLPAPYSHQAGAPQEVQAILQRS